MESNQTEVIVQIQSTEYSPELFVRILTERIAELEKIKLKASVSRWDWLDSLIQTNKDFLSRLYH